MALLGPMVVVAESSAADLIDVLRKAGAFPTVETRWADAPAAIAEVQPAAIAIADPEGNPSPLDVHAVIQCIETRGGPVTPVIALVERDYAPAIPSALAIGMDDSTDRLIARLRCGYARCMPRSCAKRTARARRRESRHSFRLICSRMQPCCASDAAASIPRFHPQSATASG